MKLLVLSCLLLLVGMPALSQTGTPAAQNAKVQSALSADIAYRKRELEREPNNPEARAQLATALEKTGDYQGMIDVLEGHKDKIGRGGLILLSRAYSRLKRFNDEISALELAIARYPKDAALVTYLAAAHAHAGARDKSIETYYKAREVNPKFIPAYEGLLGELVRAESRQEARDLLADMIKKFGSKPKWLSQLCTLFTVDSFYEKSVEFCTKAMNRDRGNTMNVVHLAATYREQGQPEKAKRVLISTANKIARSEPVHTALGDYFSEKKNYVDAYRWYKSATKADPKSFQAQLGLGLAAFELQKMEDSLAAFSAACRIDRKASREFQISLNRIRQRSDFRWQSRFEDGISENCLLRTM